VLGTPGGFVRDTLAGKNPFPNVFNPEERTTGKDLLQEWGALDKNDDSWGGFFAGLGAEILLDPLIFLTGPTKAVTSLGVKGGLLVGAKKVGKYGKKLTGSNITRVIEEIGAGERALAGLKVPFVKKPFATFGTGKRSANLLEAVAYAPGIRQTRQIFSAVPGMKYGAEKKLQMEADINYSRLLDMTASAQKQISTHGGQVNEFDALWENGLKNFIQDPDNMDIVQRVLPDVDPTNISLDDFMRTLAEQAAKKPSKVAAGEIGTASKTLADLEAIKPTAAQLLKDLGASDKLVLMGKDADQLLKLRETVKWVDESTTLKDVADRMDTLVDEAITLKDSVNDQARELGLTANILGDELIGHFPRRIQEDFRQAFGTKGLGLWARLGKKGGPFSEYMIKRSDVIRDIPTKTLKDMTKDDVLMSTVRVVNGTQKIATEIPEHFTNLGGDELARLGFGPELLVKFGVDPSDLERYGFGPEEIAGLDYKKLDKIAEGPSLSMEDFFMSSDEIESVISGELKAVDERAIRNAVVKHGDLSDVIKSVRREHVRFSSVVDEVSEEGAVKAGEIEKWIYNMPMPGVNARRDVAQTGWFNQTVMRDLSEYTRNNIDRIQGTRFALNFLARRAETDLPGGMTLAEVVKKAGLSNKAVKYLAAKGVDPNLAMVPESLSKQLKNMIEFRGNPKAESAFGETFDKIMALWKGSMTMPFPAFHDRNFVSGLWQNTMNISSGSPLEVFRGYRNAAYAMAGKKVEAGGLDLVTEAKAYNLLPEGGLKSADLVSPLISGRPLDIEALGKEALGVINPKSLARPVESGAKVHNYVEGLNRLSAFSMLLEQGKDPAAAALEVMKNHFDYGSLAKSHPLQARTLKRVIPFYTFTRFNLPRQVMDLAMRPGGRQAQNIRLFENIRREAAGNEFFPSYLKEALVIPTDESDGRKNVLKFSGLIPLQEAFNTFSFKRPAEGGIASLDYKRTLQKIGSRMNPFIVAAAEEAFGQQLYSGRPLEEIKRLPVGNYWLDRALGASPLSRAANQINQAVYGDEGAAQNTVNFLLGGVKATSFDPVIGARIEALKTIEDRMKWSPQTKAFKRISYKQDPNEEPLTPEQIRLMSLYNYLISRSRSK